MGTEHKPADWTVVSQSDHEVFVFSMCVCGNDQCYFTASVGAKQFVHIQPEDHV